MQETFINVDQASYRLLQPTLIWHLSQRCGYAGC